MKKRTLITFLGNNNYRETTYVLDDTRFATRFMGMRLAEVLDVGTIRVLGTTGSMWDVLADALQATGNPEHWVELSDAVKENRVDATLLQRFENELNAPGGRRYELRLIPYGYGASDQVDVLQVMAEGLGAQDELHLDITHGLRHLPMLGMLSSFYLQSVGQTRVQEIYYGAFTPGAPETPIVRLNGLLEIQNWIRCLDQFEKDGDYGIFAPLLDSEGLDSKLLAEAAFLERIGNLSLAQKKLGSFWNQQPAPQPASPAGRMFLPQLRKRLDWRLQTRRSEWELKLATQAFAKRDYLRCCIMAYEARLSAQVERTKGDINSYSERDAANTVLEQHTKAQKYSIPDAANFITLKNLRNQLAHGVRASVGSSNPYAQQAAQYIANLAGDESRLRQWLGGVLKQPL
ncbi:TIGR02221 family CRISPR-associated protein [Zoogloea sp.]|uniref:TIGR02221 family CRISPR-associated protein n=1 Tax=Zoogloea sp. TaxID=49181 RepID=UPI0035B1CB58